MAGIIAMTMMSLYVISGTFWAIMKAADPMIGGMSCPPVEAVASVAAATWGLNPAFFIIGMVNDPDATVFATAEPETIPCRPEATTAAFAGPPVYLPAARKARSLKNCPILVRSRMTAKKRNRKINCDDTWIGVLKIPDPVERNMLVEKLSHDIPACRKTGLWLPNSAYRIATTAMTMIGRPTHRRVPSSTRMIP